MNAVLKIRDTRPLDHLRRVAADHLSPSVPLNHKRLLSTTVLYGAADFLVLGIGGFLLLPLYTRTLTQSEFGTYVVIKANAEIFSYILYLGLPSAMARLYFDYQKRGDQFRYVNSILMLFLCNAIIVGVVLGLWGGILWSVLSPGVAADPYLWWAYAMACAGFLPAIVGIWLRLEGKATTFVSVQLITSAVLVVLAFIGLVSVHAGLPGLLAALLGSTCCAALAMPILLGRRFRPVAQWSHISASLHFAIPIVIGYLAYFVLNRIGTLVLQRHVDVARIGVFGLGQQLALIVAMSGIAFGKALQPVVFASDGAHAVALLDRAGRLFLCLLFCVASLVVIFSADLLRLVAPSSYQGSRDVLLVLVVASFVYAIKLIPDTALLFFRRPKTSVAISVAGASLSAGLTWLLVPPFQMTGAAVAVALAAILMTSAAFVCADRAGASQRPSHALVATTILAGLAYVTGRLDTPHDGLTLALGLKALAAILFVGGALLWRARGEFV